MKPLSVITAAALALASVVKMIPVSALPPPDDIPEEILRAQVILEARSPINGEPLTAAEYAQLQADLQESTFAPTLDSELQHLFFLLRVRRMLRTLIPPIRLLD